MRRAVITQTALFLFLSLLVVSWCQPAAAYSLKVKAWVDGESQLIIQGNTVQWHNLAYNAPGYEYPYHNPPAPTYLTTKDMGTVALTPSGWSKGPPGTQLQTCLPSSMHLWPQQTKL